MRQTAESPGVWFNHFWFNHFARIPEAIRIARHAKPSCPAKRGIQYAAACRFNHCRLWITGSSAPVNCAQADDDTEYASPSRGAEAPEVWPKLSPKGGRREDRVRAAPAIPCAMCTRCAHEHTGPAESIRPSLRNGLTAYGALSLETISSFLHHRRIDGFASPVGFAKTSAELDTSHGCQDHTVLPYAASFTNPSSQPFATGRSFGRGVQAPSVYTLSIAHGKPPCEHACAPNAAASTAPHPATFRDDRDTPLVEGMRCGELWE